MPSNLLHDLNANIYGHNRVTERKVDGVGPNDFKGVTANYTAAMSRSLLETRALAVIPGLTTARMQSMNTNDLLYGIRNTTDAGNIY